MRAPCSYPRAICNSCVHRSDRPRGSDCVKRESRHLAVRRLQVGRDGRPPRLVDPCAAPRREVFVSPRVEDRDEIGPRRVPEGKAAEVLAQAVAQLIGPEYLLELAHDDRRLQVDDRSVQAAGVFQVVERLPNRIRAGRTVDVVGRRMMLQEEAQLVIDVWKRRVDDLRRHEVRKHFLQPHVVEPLHRDEIAEPHVRCFVRDQVRAPQLVILRRGCVEQQVRRVVENGAGMLHASELKRRQQHEIELLKRVLAIGVGFEPFDRLLMEIEKCVSVGGNFRRVGLTVVHVECAAAALAPLDRKLSGRKAEQVCRKGGRLAESHRHPITLRVATHLGRIRDRGPVGRNLERERERSFDVGLVETGKCLRRARGHEERVEKFVVPIQRLVAGGKGNVDDVLAELQRFCRNDEMALLRADGDRLAVGAD